MPQPNQRMPQYPFAVPRMPYPPTMAPAGYPMPFAKPPSETTYKSPYQSSTPAAPSAGPSGLTNGSPMASTANAAQALSTQNGSSSIDHSVPSAASAGAYAGLSSDVLAAVQKFRTTLFDSVDDKAQAEKLFGVAMQKTFPSTSNGAANVPPAPATTSSLTSTAI